MVRQVPVVATLMIVEGVLELLCGLYYTAMGPIMAVIVGFTGGKMPPPTPGTPNPQNMMLFVGGIYVGLGVINLAAGIIKIVAGIQNYRFRGRILGFVAIGSSIATMFTCYCWFTAIGLCIYGLIVYCHNDVGRAFKLAARGYTVDQIKSGA